MDREDDLAIRLHLLRTLEAMGSDAGRTGDEARAGAAKRFADAVRQSIRDDFLTGAGVLP